MAKFFIDRPIFAIVLSILITVGGLIAAFNLPIAQYPQITPPQISVSTNYRGANADVVEQSIAQVIEQQINGVENMVSMQSTSSDSGAYSLNIQFELGKDADLASVQSQNRVAQANPSLPQEVQQSGVTTLKSAQDMALIFALWSPKGTYDNAFLKNYGSIYLVEELKRVKGIGSIREFGSDYGMRIWLQPDKMAQLGITSTDISSAISKQNIQAPAGTIGQQPSTSEQEFQYSARVKGRLAEPAEFEKIIIRAQSDGSFVRVKDVAKVELGSRDYSFSTDMNGHQAVGFAIQLSSDANALETITAAQKVIADAAKRFPPDLEYRTIVDNTQFVRESMSEVAKTFAEALALVTLVVFIFLQSWRATLIPMLAIPVSLIGTFGAFLILGFSINTLTLFAMVLAIGLVVDDAIVVIEAVEHHMRYGRLSPLDATKKAMSEVSGPVIAIAFVLASVFLPVAFFGGTMGVLYKQFALTVAVSVGLSAIVALSLTPALCRLLLKPYDPDAHGGWLGRFFDKFNIWFEKTVEGYGGRVGKLIRKAPLAVALLAVVIILAGALYRVVPSSFVPAEDQGYYITAINLPEAASMNRTRAVANKLADEIRSQPGVANTFVVTGFDLLGGGGNKPNAAVVFTGLTPWSERETPALQVGAQIMNVMRNSSHLPEATVISLNPPSLPGLGMVGGFTMMLQDKGGKSIEEMDGVSKQFISAARKRPEIGMIYTTFRSDTPGYRFDVDREKAEKLGIPVNDVFNALQTFLGGMQVNDFNQFGRTYKVVMQAEPQFRNDVDATRFFFLRSSSGTMVPLNTLVKPEPVNGPPTIKRFNGARAIQINGSPAPGYSSGQALAALEEVAAQTLPTGFGYEWIDQSREEKISGGKAPMVFGLALLFVFLCLAALYESWSIPFAVLLCVPTGVFGAFLFQYARNLENSVYMQIGLVMLIGLAAKNAILIVEFAKVRVERGMDPVHAAVEAAKLRLRAIIMTSLAFIIGCVPLVIATGAGAGARNAMGTAVVGGMVMATTMGIFMIPVLYVVVVKITKRIRRLRQGTKKQEPTRISDIA
ncbi:multidrug efflux RND transporter permease subunit [Sporomusa sp.]|uniref:efflux RND transporter permease subunit n=1 Tax=Sporomusa sp. TaxID=2078658 RepID=UPI002C3608AC|nr:multidrug efflux RND transporter permease subunit [Sporomusa sp.]HWR45918.1 multidrug efflux RND transporter permease subunit [Sporomusa sp.]